MCRVSFGHARWAHVRLSLEKVVWLGADEMGPRNWRNYLTVFADLLAKRVLRARSRKGATVWQAVAAKILRYNARPEAIRHVAIKIGSPCTKG